MQPPIIASLIGALLNIGVTITLFRSQLKKSMENTLLISYFVTNALSSYFTFSGHTSCKVNGFGMQICNLASQLALLSVAWKYIMKKQVSRWIYLAMVWIPCIAAFLLIPNNNSYIRGPWDTCIKDYKESNTYWMVLEISAIFLSTLTLSLATLITYSVSRNNDLVVEKKRHGFLRLFAFLIFDSFLCFLNGMHNIFAAIANYGPNGIAFVIGTLQFMHTTLSPLLFLLLHNRIRKAMLRLATGSRYGTALSPAGSRMLSDNESMKSPDSATKTRSVSNSFSSPVSPFRLNNSKDFHVVEVFREAPLHTRSPTRIVAEP
jgi:hypothetical protein